MFIMFWQGTLLCIIVFISFPVSGQEPTDNDFSFKWNNGFELKSADDNFTLKFGGKIYLDFAHFHQSNSLDENYGFLEKETRTELRSARMFFSGKVYQNIHFKLQVDFAGNEVEVKDAYLKLTELPAAGNLMVGYFHEPFRLSSLTSSKHGNFKERANHTRFAESRNLGIMVFNDFANGRISAQFAVFGNASNKDDNLLVNDGYVTTARLTALPFITPTKDRLLHLGVGYSLRKPDSKQYEISLRPASHMAEKYITTGLIENVRDVNLVNFEAAYVLGSLSLQAEYLLAQIHTADSSLDFWSYYGEISWFITGEHKVYKGSYDGFGRVIPHRNFGPSGGAGAWELALRYSQTHLDKVVNQKGDQSEIILGLNWYLNPVTRFRINYARTEIGHLGKLDIVQCRLQVDF